MKPERITLLSKERCEAWLKSHQYGAPVDAGCAYRQEIRTPQDAGQKAFIVKSILNWMPSDGQGLVFVTDWGIWASQENPELFHLVRMALCSEQKTLNEAPGQLLDLADRVALECLLDVCVFSLWDATLADGQRRFVWRCSHDEYMTIACNAELVQHAESLIEFLTRPDGPSKRL